jgi:hypothetical protein
MHKLIVTPYNDQVINLNKEIADNGVIAINK